MASQTEQRKIQILADGSQVNATFNDMAAAAKLLQNQLRKLPPESEEFAQKSEQLKGIKTNMNYLKRDVYGTENALKDMNEEFLQMTPFGGMINTITDAMGKMITGLAVLTKGFHTLKGVIVSTGLGALAVALGLIVNYFMSIQDGINKIGKAAQATGEFIGESVDQGLELAELNKTIEETENQLTVSRAKLNAEFQESREIAQDVSKSEEERLAAAKRAQEAQNELLDQEQEFMDLKIQRKELENSFNDTSRADEKELKELIAQRTDFEAQAARKRMSAKTLENQVNKQIHTENMKRADEVRKKEEENQKRLDELRKEYLKATVEAEQKAEDLRITLMDEGADKKMAKLDLELDRELEKLEERRVKLLENEALTETELQQVRDQFAELSELKRQEHRQKIAEIKEEEREADIEKQFEQFDEDQEREMLLVENAMINATDSETRKKEALLEIQREYLNEKLALLRESGQGETLQALRLKNQLAQIDTDIADNKIAEAERAENFKVQIQQTGLNAAKEFLQMGLQLMEEEAKGRKALATTLKALEIGQVITDGIREVAAIWKGAATLGPIAGPIVGGIQTAAAVARTGVAVNKIRTTQYATGGTTGSGSVIDMVMGRDGSWSMPDGTRTGWVGTYAKGGHINSPSFGVIGEKGAEWVGPNWMLRSPKYANIFGYLEAERQKATPFATGGATASMPQHYPLNSSATADLQKFMAMIEQFEEMKMVMEDIRTLVS